MMSVDGGICRRDEQGKGRARFAVCLLLQAWFAKFKFRKDRGGRVTEGGDMGCALYIHTRHRNPEYRYRIQALSIIYCSQFPEPSAGTLPATTTTHEAQ